MSRPTLTLEQLVLRPGYVEAMSALHGLFRDSGATLPTLYEQCKRGLGTPRKAATVRLVHRLHRLGKEGLVRYDPFAPEYLRMETKGRDRGRGRPPSGKWVLTEEGVDYWDARLSLEVAKRTAAAILKTPGARIHVPQVATPTVLIVNCEPVREDFIGLRRMLEGPSIVLGRPARQVALQEWARNPRIISDWKALQTLKAKHPRDNTGEYTIPERLALKPWHPAVRGAYRRAEKHRLLVVLEVNPAYWDDLPIEELELLRKDYLAARKRRDLAFARARKARQSAPAPS
jgi:hypothetical protein